MPEKIVHLAPKEPGVFVCPEHQEYGCTGTSGRRRLKFLRSLSEQWGCVVTRHDVYRCPVCRGKFVSTNGGEPEPAAEWI